MKTSVSESYVHRVFNEVEAGQETAGAVVSNDDREIAERQLRGELSADQAVEEAVRAARTRVAGQ